MSSNLERFFPNLSSTGYEITSPIDVNYNCIAWAAGDTSRRWWPDVMMQYYWPPGAPREETVDALVKAYGTLGFTPCASGELEEGREKIALYGDGGKPTHAARQLPDGRWTSKLGELEDVEHDLDGLTGTDYGHVVRFLVRARS